MRLAQLNYIGMSAEYLGQVVAMRVEASLVSIPVHLDRGSVCWTERWGTGTHVTGVTFVTNVTGVTGVTFATRVPSVTVSTVSTVLTVLTEAPGT